MAIVVSSDSRVVCDGLEIRMCSSASLEFRLAGCPARNKLLLKFQVSYVGPLQFASCDGEYSLWSTHLN